MCRFLILYACDRAGPRLRRLLRPIRNLAGDESGATMIEYGLIITGISIAILATVFAIGDRMDTMFTDIHSRMESRFDRL